MAVVDDILSPPSVPIVSGAAPSVPKQILGITHSFANLLTKDKHRGVHIKLYALGDAGASGITFAPKQGVQASRCSVAASVLLVGFGLQLCDWI